MGIFLISKFKCIVFILTALLLFPISARGNESSQVKKQIKEWKYFKDYKRLILHTGKNIYDQRISPDELGRLKDLWAKAKHHYVFDGKIQCEGLEATEASYILDNNRFLKIHVVFLLNAYPRVVCMHNQFLSDNPCVIGLDGKYFGSPSDKEFNQIMERENNEVGSENIIAFIDLYLNLTSGVWLITEELLSDYINIIDEDYSEYNDFKKEVLKLVHAPTLKQIGKDFEVSFFTYGPYTTQIPYGLNKWKMGFDKIGRIKNKQVELIVEYDFPDKLKYGNLGKDLN